VFRHSISYRCYTLAKIGLSLAYLWFISDFFRIHQAYWQGMSLLLPDPGAVASSASFPFDLFLRGVAFVCHSKAAVWLILIASPFAAGLFVWGHGKWIQLAVTGWLSCSMIAMVSFVGVFASAADVWLHFAFVSYGVTLLLCPAEKWEEREPGFTLARWKQDPVLSSSYAWLLVLIQFSVYFFAGVSKLVEGWDPWIGGYAIENLAFDSSMRDFVRGVHVPHLISWIFCYVTLFQRLIVPFGFFSMRLRGWAFLILVSMHLGYALLMRVAIFPVVGIAFLFMIVPPGLALPPFRASSLPRQERRKMTRGKEAALSRTSRLAIAVIVLFSGWLLFESSRIALFGVVPVESQFMLAPAWRMFASGGVQAGEKWRLLLMTPAGEVDGTDGVVRLLPHLWRDRFYLDVVLHGILDESGTQQTLDQPDPLLARVLSTGESHYRDRQIQLQRDPTILKSGFSLYRRASAH